MKQTAQLYRMVTKNHICPFGIKSKDLLQRKGYIVKDHHLTTREQTDAYKIENNVQTTPQTFIDGKRIGGYDDLRNFFDMSPAKKQGKSYQPVIAVFLTAFFMALSVSLMTSSSFQLIRVIELFIAISMCILAILKLRDLFSFSNQFITYDLLAMRFVPYAYIYPFVEAIAGIFMISEILIFIVAPATLFIATINGISVFKAVYIDKRDIKCACVGGGSNVPLGFISLTENIMMICMAVWMLFKSYVFL